MSSFVREFINEFASRGVMRGNKFLAIMTGPPNLDIGFDPRRIALATQSVSVPSSNFFTKERILSGPKREISYSLSYTEPLVLTVVNDLDAYATRIFDNWQSEIINQYTRTVSYYDDYALGSDMVVWMVPQNVNSFDGIMSAIEANQVIGFKYTDVYPKNTKTASMGPNVEKFMTEVSLAYRECFMLPLNGNPENLMASVDSLAEGSELVNEHGLPVQETTELPLARDGNILEPTENPFDIINRITKDFKPNVAKASNGLVIEPENH